MKKKHIHRHIIIFFFFFFCLSWAKGQLPVLEISKISENVDLDGQLNESFWKKISIIQTLLHGPKGPEKPSEEDQFFVVQDQHYLYLACKIFAENPYPANDAKDSFGLESDWIGMGFSDPKQPSAMNFFLVSPSDKTMCLQSINDMGDIQLNQNFHRLAEAKTFQSEGYWTAEIRIPLGIIRKQEASRKQELGLIIWRNNAYYEEISTWPFIPNKWAQNSSFNPLLARTAQIIIPDQKLNISGHVYAQQSVIRDLNNFEPETLKYPRRLGGEVQLDWNANHQTTVQIMPDFADTEPNELVVNLQPFQYYYPEKRSELTQHNPFFQQTFNRKNSLFYSQNIGANIYNTDFPLQSGIIHTSQINNTSIGLLHYSQANTQRIYSMSTVGRLQQAFLNQKLKIGVTMTNYRLLKSYQNSVIGLDGQAQLGNNNYASLQWAQSFDNVSNSNNMGLRNARLHASLERNQFTGFSYLLQMDHVGSGYENLLGFEDYQNYTLLESDFGFGWTNQASSIFQRQKVELINFLYLNNDRIRDEILRSGFKYTLEWKSTQQLEVFYHVQVERLYSPTLKIPGLTIPAAIFPQSRMGLNYKSSRMRTTQYQMNLMLGDFYNGNFISLKQNINFPIGSHVHLGAYYEYTPIFPFAWPGVDRIDIHLIRGKIKLAWSNRFSFQTYIQTSNIYGIGIGFAQVEYKPLPYLDVQLNYHNQSDLDILLQEKDIPQGIRRQRLNAKIIYTFDWQKKS